MPSRMLTLLCALLCAIALAAVVTNATRPVESLQQDLVIDDGVYYVQTARNFVAGRGYSLDGEHRSNGVQPLWAMLVTAAAWFVRDPICLLRALVLMSGTFWVLGGWLLFRWLREHHVLAGAIAMAVWLLAGFENRLSMIGMENGLNGLVSMFALTSGRRLAATAATALEWRRRAWVFGLAAGLLPLVRVETALLTALFWVWLVWRHRTDGLPAALRRTLPFVVPPVVLGGTWLCCCWFYFGELLPIAGTVKAWNTANNPLAPTLVAGLQANLLTTAWLALAGPALALVDLLAPHLQRLPRTEELLLLVGACLLPALPAVLAVWRWRAAFASPTAAVLLPFAVFVLVHLLLLSTVMAPYTSYCLWYFAVEVLSVCLLLGGVVGSPRAWWRWPLLLPLTAVVAFATVQRVPTWFACTTNDAMTPYVRLGRWLESWLPPGSRVGAFAAGYVGLEASSHTVVNLDGLINDGRFLREYVMRHRIADYFADERLDYFADNLPAAQWRSYLTTDVAMLPKGMRPLHAWASTPTEITAVLARSHVETPAHPLGELLFATLALGRMPTIGEAERGQLPADQRIVASLVLPPGDQLRHIVAPATGAAALVDRRGLERIGGRPIDYGVRLRLLGVDAPASVPGRLALVHVFVQPGAEPGTEALELELTVGSEGTGRPLAAVTAPLAHGTLPGSAWPAAGLVCHSVAVPLPATLPTGQHALRLGIRPTGGPWLATTDASGTATHPRVGSLTVRAR